MTVKVTNENSEEIERIAQAIKFHVMDDNRCWSIGQPKTPPCGEGCVCMADARVAAALAWQAMQDAP